MEYIKRTAEAMLRHHIERGKSILLLGPRQTGKSTLLKQFQADLTISFVLPRTRQRYEKDPSLLQGEIEALPKSSSRDTKLILLDEVQKVPHILDVIQDVVDRGAAQFILTGSSARKLRRGASVNLLPGRIVTMRLDPFVYQECSESSLQHLLLYGSLPGILQEKNLSDREVDLLSYVETYLEEEVRAEALVRNLGTFYRFLELAGLESGKLVSFRALSQDIGVSHTTIISYFEILEDCLIVERIDPLTHSRTRKKLTKSSRYVLFDLGVRRLCAGEGTKLPPDRLGELFEQFVGLELIRMARLARERTHLRFWRDPDGPEVDWLLEKGGEYLPIEVKWTDHPHAQDARHLRIFLNEYPQAKHAYIICRTPQAVQIDDRITALPWQQIPSLL